MWLRLVIQCIELELGAYALGAALCGLLETNLVICPKGYMGMQRVT